MRSRLFTQQVVIVALFAAIAGLACYDPSGLRGDADFNRTLQICKRASKVEVFEGLPHPENEQETFAKEKLRSDVFQNHDFDFYQPAISLSPGELDRFISASSSRWYFRVIRPDQPAVACGRFHPDFLVRFRGANEIVDVQICLGCGMAAFYGPTGRKFVDLSHWAHDKWMSLHSGYRVKRPVRGH
jgi:hypothetical protein